MGHNAFMEIWIMTGGWISYVGTGNLDDLATLRSKADVS